MHTFLAKFARLAVVALFAGSLVFVAPTTTPAVAAVANLTECKFSPAQVFDTQWSNNGTTLTVSGLTRPFSNSGQLAAGYLASTDYFSFFASTTNPGKYGVKIFDSTGAERRVLHNYGIFTALGADFVFWNGSGSYGTLFTTSQGYAYGGSASLPVTASNPSDATAFAYTNCSVVPLAQGQTQAQALAAQQFTITYGTFGKDGGSAPAAVTATTGASVTLAGNTGVMTKSGFNFGGWATATAAATAISNTYTLTANVTLYPVWTAVTVTPQPPTPTAIVEPPKPPVPTFSGFVGAKPSISSSSTELSIENLSGLSSIKIGGAKATYTVTAAGSIKLDLPETNGFVDLVIETASGTLTIVNAFDLGNSTSRSVEMPSAAVLGKPIKIAAPSKSGTVLSASGSYCSVAKTSDGGFTVTGTNPTPNRCKITATNGNESYTFTLPVG